MKILYIHQYFCTPKDPGGTRSYWIAKELIASGHEVTMLTTSRNGEATKKVVIDGINVIYVNVPYNNKMNIVQRLFAFVRFMLHSSWIALFGDKPDLIIATSTPLTIGFPALVAKKLRGVPFLFEVRDLWPEVPVQMEGIKNRYVIKLAYWFERVVYRNAKHIVALSPGMKQGVLKTGIPNTKVTTIPNMSKIDEFKPMPITAEKVTALGLKQESFKVVYFGTMGIANGMEYIIDAMSFIKDSDNIEFVFLGGGAREELIQRKCREQGLDNVFFYGVMPMAQLAQIVNVCNVSLVTFKNLPILATNSPNKLFDTLSAGKAIIVNSNGWTKELVEKNECGLYADPENPENLAKKILKLKNNPELCERLGQNGRRLAETTFDKSILCKKFADIVDGLA